MSPRALSEEQRDRQRLRIMQKGRELVMAHGFRKISVDEIIRASGLAKGTFYLYFVSKEAFLGALVMTFLEDFFGKAEQMIRKTPREDLPTQLGIFIRHLFALPESVFFFKNHDDLEEIVGAMTGAQVDSVKQLEAENYEKLLTLAGIDTCKVKPGVVHNLLHAMYMTMSEGLMVRESMEETFSVMLDCLIRYIFGGIQ